MKESTKFKEYFGITYPTIRYWTQNGISFRKLYKEMLSKESLRAKRKAFYEEFFSAKVDASRVDTLWEKFVQAHLKRVERKEGMARFDRAVKLIKKEMEEGKIL